MRKKLVSFVAAAALLGSVSLATAGTITTSGDTNIQIGGFVNQMFIWSNNQAGLSLAPNAPASGKSPNTSFSSTANWTRLDLTLSNPTEGITGEISGDFFGSNQQNPYGGNFRLREAWVKKDFCQAGCNYTPWLLFGQTWAIGDMPQMNNFSLNAITGIAGDNGNQAITRVPMIAFGVKYDLGFAKINPQIAFEDVQGNINVATNESLRSRFPGVGINIPVTFNTGLGTPATFQISGEWQQLKTNYDNNLNGYDFGSSILLPVRFVNLLGEFHYESGLNYMDNTGFGPAIPYGFGSNGQATKSLSWSVQAQLDGQKLANVPVTVAFGYGQTKFSNYVVADYSNPTLDKYSTIFVNVNYNLTKSLSLGVEYDRNNGYFIGNSTEQHSDQVLLVGQYNF
ncbi:MAG: hypothetical protein QXP36_10190 [Conexivisphaerales archaeon]